MLDPDKQQSQANTIDELFSRSRKKKRKKEKKKDSDSDYLENENRMDP